LWVLEMIPKEKQRALHGHIASALGRRKLGSAQEIAHHWLQSDKPRNGIAAALDAARSLARAHEDRSALRFFGAVLDFLPSSDRRRLSVAEEAAEACFRAGDYRRGIGITDEVLALLKKKRGAGRWHGRKGILCHRAGDLAE